MSAPNTTREIVSDASLVWFASGLSFTSTTSRTLDDVAVPGGQMQR